MNQPVLPGQSGPQPLNRPAPEPPPAGPGRGWYGLALGLVVLAVLVRCGGGFFGTRVVPDPIATARIGDSVTVTLGAEEDFVIVVSLDAVAPGVIGPRVANCSIDLLGEGASSTGSSPGEPGERLLTTGDRQWRLDHHVVVGERGPYQLTCRSDSPAVDFTRFGVAKAPSSGRAAISLGVTIGCPYALLFAAAILALVIRTKRSRVRRRAGGTRPAAPPAR